jgi:hypothetical protein
MHACDSLAGGACWKRNLCIPCVLISGRQLHIVMESTRDHNPGWFLGFRAPWIPITILTSAAGVGALLVLSEEEAC